MKTVSPRWLMLISGLWVILIISGGLWFYQDQETRLRRTAEAELQTVAQLKIDEIASWRADRLADAAVLTGSPIFIEGASRWMADRQTDDAEAILTQFRSLRQHYHYQDLLLVDSTGEVCLNLTDHPELLQGETLQVLTESWRRRQAMMTDLYRAASDNLIYLDVASPLFIEEDLAPMGAVILRCDARPSLYPLIQSWPAPSNSAETLLVRREGEAVLFLNELRHQKDAAMKLRLPLDRADVPSVMAVSGLEGLVSGKDYRGIEVLAALKAVPDSPWFIVAKVDAEESFSVWRFRSTAILSLILLLLFVPIVTVGMFWQRNQKTYYLSLAQAQATLGRSEERYHFLADNTLDAIWMMDMNLRFTYVNPAIQRMFGYSPEEWIGTLLADRCDKEYMNQMMSIIAHELKNLDEHRGVIFETVMQRRDGSPIAVEIHWTFLFEPNRLPVALQGTTRDITQRKKLEDQLLQSQKMEAVGLLAGGVAHDFNNLLSVILGYGEILLADSILTADQKSGILNIYEAGLRAETLTRQLLAFGRKQTLEIKVVELNTLIMNFDKLLRRTIGEDIVLDLALCPAEPRVRADAVQLEQVLLNLVVNARDAMPDGGRLTIETALIYLDENYAAGKPGVLPGNYVMIGVSDEGRGMDRETIQHIFEPFFTTKEKGQGTGLGLSMVYGIVKQHGGNIWVYSEPGQGTTFKVYLPQVSEALQPERKRVEPVASLAGTATVLVVEDEPSVRHLVCAILANRGCQVLESGDVAEAVSMAREYAGPIHLVLTDVVMPGMKGTEVYKSIAASHPKAKVLYMSGYTENVIVRQGILMEGVQFLQKPFTVNQLLEKVARTLEE